MDYEQITKKFDEGKTNFPVGVVVLLTAVCVIAAVVLGILGFFVLMWLGIGLALGISVGFALYANSGKRYRKDDEKE